MRCAGEACTGDRADLRDNSPDPVATTRYKRGRLRYGAGNRPATVATAFWVSRALHGCTACMLIGSTNPVCRTTAATSQQGWIDMITRQSFLVSLVTAVAFCSMPSATSAMPGRAALDAAGHVVAVAACPKGRITCRRWCLKYRPNRGCKCVPPKYPKGGATCVRDSRR